MYQFRGCPDVEDFETVAGPRDRPAHVLVRERPGGDEIADGYVLENVDLDERTADCLWGKGADPGTVTTFLLQALAEVASNDS